VAVVTERRNRPFDVPGLHGDALAGNLVEFLDDPARKNTVVLGTSNTDSGVGQGDGDIESVLDCTDIAVSAAKDLVKTARVGKIEFRRRVR